MRCFLLTTVYNHLYIILMITISITYTCKYRLDFANNYVFALITKLKKYVYTNKQRA